MLSVIKADVATTKRLALRPFLRTRYTQYYYTIRFEKLTVTDLLYFV